LPHTPQEDVVSEPLAFGVFGEVLEPGPVRIGDGLIPE
jgi:hypothetical protein